MLTPQCVLSAFLLPCHPLPAAVPIGVACQPFWPPQHTCWCCWWCSRAWSCRLGCWLGPDQQAEWLVNCYRTRLDDDCCCCMHCVVASRSLQRRAGAPSLCMSTAVIMCVQVVKYTSRHEACMTSTTTLSRRPRASLQRTF